MALSCWTEWSEIGTLLRIPRVENVHAGSNLALPTLHSLPAIIRPIHQFHVCFEAKQHLLTLNCEPHQKHQSLLVSNVNPRWMFQFKPTPSSPKPYITPHFWNNRTTNLQFMYACMHQYVFSWRRWRADHDNDLLRCLSKVKNARPLLHPVLVVHNDSCDPGLLEHHLWHPYFVSPLLLDFYLPAKKKRMLIISP